jgi:CheY-like chemotaxis protein
MPSPLTILLIEDHDDAREAMRALLELEGHAVEAASNGSEGLEMAKHKRVDVGLIDIGLPGVDGYEVARRIRALGGPQPFLIALTGYGQPEDRKLAVDAGFNAHLVKPVDPADLVRVLATVPGRHAG